MHKQCNRPLRIHACMQHAYTHSHNVAITIPTPTFIYPYPTVHYSLPYSLPYSLQYSLQYMHPQQWGTTLLPANAPVVTYASHREKYGTPASIRLPWQQTLIIPYLKAALIRSTATAALLRFDVIGIHSSLQLFQGF